MRRNRFLSASLLAIGGAMACCPAVAVAQQASFSIPPMPLDAALKLYAIQSGDELLAPADLVARVPSGGASGWLSREEALRSILKGTGIEAVRLAGGVVSFRKAASDQAKLTPAAFAVQAEASPLPAPAPPAAEGPPVLGEIIVTAQRRSESQQRVPISVTVASGVSLEAQAVRTLEDLSVRQANIRIAQAPASDQIHVRGTGSGFGNGFEQSVATFVDGVYRNRSRSSRVALFDVDRVEILKGPQTTYFGANAIAGALNITSRKPGHAFEANAVALYAPSDGEYNLEAAAGGPVSESLAVRVAGRLSGMDGYIKSDTGLDKAPRLNDKQARISVRWTPTEALEVSARYDIARLRDRGTFAAELINCPPAGLPSSALCTRAAAITGRIDDELNWRSGTLDAGYADVDLDEVVVGANLDLGAVTVVSTTGYMHQKVASATNLSPFPVLSPVGTRSYFNVTLAETFEQFSQELRLQSSGDGPLSYMVGAYYEHGALDMPVYTPFFFAPVGAAAAPTYGPASLVAARGITSQTSETWSGFGTLSYEIVEGLTASAGLRYTTVRKSASRAWAFGLGQPHGRPEGFVPGPASVQAPLARATGTSHTGFPVGARTDEKLMPSVNLRYQVTSEAMVYGSYTKGFKAGGFSGQTPDVFGPETVDAYEAGLKSSWLGRRLVLNLALFRSDFSNLQETQSTTTPTGSPIVVVGNSAASRSQGVEVSLTWRATPSLTLQADAAYTDSKYIRYPNGTCSPIEAIGVVNCVKDRAGVRRAFAPEWSGSVGADYTAPFIADTQLRLGGLLYFTSSFFQQSTFDALVEQSAYAKLDLRAAVGPEDRRWEVAVIAKNVTDEGTAYFRAFAPGAVGSGIAVPDRPRSVAIQLSSKW